MQCLARTVVVCTCSEVVYIGEKVGQGRLPKGGRAGGLGKGKRIIGPSNEKNQNEAKNYKKLACAFQPQYFKPIRSAIGYSSGSEEIENGPCLAG